MTFIIILTVATFYIYHITGSSTTSVAESSQGLRNFQIWGIVWQEYKYDWSEHMARDERFHPAIMVSSYPLLYVLFQSFIN